MTVFGTKMDRFEHSSKPSDARTRGAAVHCLSEHVSVYLQIGLFSEGITGDHIGITLFRGDHRGSHERFHIYRLTYQPGQRGSHQSVIR